MVNKKIGELNGPWAVLLRLALGSYPLVVSWCIWITVQEFEDKAFRERGNTFTATDAAILENRLNEKIAESPSQDWKNRIVGIETTQRDILDKLSRIQGALDAKAH
jgi:low affinity Fe/Cu permease